jgi:hypothetical protein
MMFLLRWAFWLSVALALLPTFAPRQASTVPAEVSAADAVTAASATLADLTRFCERRPAFGGRAREGAKIVYDFVGGRLGKQDRPEGQERHDHQERSPVAVGNAEPAPAEAAKASQNTLTSSDVASPWRGPQPRRDPGGRHAT